MDSFGRMNLVARITYYLGLLALASGAAVHFGVGTAMFQTLNLSKRNLFESAILCFLICMTSELRAIAINRGAEEGITTKRAA